jgi:hypothetical protein
MVNAKKYGAGAKEAYLEKRVVRQNPLTVSSAMKIQEGGIILEMMGALPVKLSEHVRCEFLAVGEIMLIGMSLCGEGFFRPRLVFRLLHQRINKLTVYLTPASEVAEDFGFGCQTKGVFEGLFGQLATPEGSVGGEKGNFLAFGKSFDK